MSFASKISDWLYQSGQPTADECRQLRALGVTALVSANREDPILAEEASCFGPGRTYHLAWADDGTEKPVADFARLRRWFAGLTGDPVVLSHCSAGIHRSTMVSCWLLLLRGDADSVDDAFARVKARRPEAALPPPYRASLLRAARALLGK